jgi:hypothetical protein
MQCLSSHPSVPSKQTHEHVWVCPRDKSGFPVGIHDRGRQFTIYHSFWHQDFEDPNKAVTCFMFGLTAAERLKVVARGNKEHRWEVETCVDGNWASIDRVGLIFFPFWRRPRIRYLSTLASRPIGLWNPMSIWRQKEWYFALYLETPGALAAYQVETTEQENTVQESLNV